MLDAFIGADREDPKRAIEFLRQQRPTLNPQQAVVLDVYLAGLARDPEALKRLADAAKNPEWTREFREEVLDLALKTKADAGAVWAAEAVRSAVIAPAEIESIRRLRAKLLSASLTEQVKALDERLGRESPSGEAGAALRSLGRDLDLWIDPRRMKPAETLPVLKELAPHLRRLYLTVFASGQTLHPTEIPPFEQMAEAKGWEEIGGLCKASAASGVGLYAVLDLLRWEERRQSEARLFKKHPDWFELNWGGLAHYRGDGCWASPFHPSVRKALVGLAEEVARTMPYLHGVLVRCRLPETDLLGYSVASRTAYIRARSIDPLDLQPGSTSQEMKDQLVSWGQWRQQEMVQVVGLVARAFRGQRTEAKIGLLGLDSFVLFNPQRQGYPADNWLTALVDGHADFVVLEASGPQTNAQRAYGFARQLVDKAVSGNPVDVRVVVPLAGETEGPASPRQPLHVKDVLGLTHLAVLLPEDASALAQIRGTLGSGAGSREGKP